MSKGEKNNAAYQAAVKLLQSLTAGGTIPLPDELMQQTPRRYAKAWCDLTAGYHEINNIKFTTFPASEYGGGSMDQMVTVKDIQFYSLCEHHLVPFFGTVSVLYVPGDKLVGLSKIPRVVQAYAKRIQVQERMTEQIAWYLIEHLEPRGVCVVVQAQHLCMIARGVQSLGSYTVTSKVTGVFKEDAKAREEAFLLL